MQNGKINKSLKYYSKRKAQHLIMLWALFFVVVIVNIVVFLTIKSGLIKTLVLFITLVGLFILLLFEKSLISHYSLQHRYYLLLSKQEKTLKTKSDFSISWLNSLREEGFKQAVNNNKYTIFYRISKSITKRSFFKTQALEFLTIFHDNKVDLYADELENEYRTIWFTHEKENRLNKQIIIQIKKYSHFNEEVKNELDKIIMYKEGDNYLITINCGYISNEGKLYFLHSNNYHPNLYYKYTVDLIKKLLL